ncbi:hypothetical protein VIGAN_02338900, partial [Vigna angularis var. angularis]
MKEVEVEVVGWWLLIWICCLNLLSPSVSFYPLEAPRDPNQWGFTGTGHSHFMDRQINLVQHNLLFPCTMLSMLPLFSFIPPSAGQPNLYVLSVMSCCAKQFDKFYEVASSSQPVVIIPVHQICVSGFPRNSIHSLQIFFIINSKPVGIGFKFCKG